MRIPRIFSEFLAFESPLVIRVHDVRLALLHRLLQLLAIVWIVVNFVQQKLYLLTEPPTSGSTRVSLRAPAQWTPRANLSYCRAINSDGVTVNSLQDTLYIKGQNVDCVWIDRYNALYPAGEEKTAFFTSRISTEIYQLNATKGEECRPTFASKLIARKNELNFPAFSSPDCQYVQKKLHDAYVAEIEEFTMMIAHTVLAKDHNFVARSSNMKGQLIDRQGNVVKEWSDKSRPGDIMKIGTMLKAAGVDLADKSTAAGNETNRFAGIVILVSIVYTGDSAFSSMLSSDATYQYVPYLVPDEEYKIEQSIFDVQQALSVIDRHGIRIVFEQSGQIGSFNIPNLLLNIIAAFALFGVASFIVEQIMCTLLPQRKHYKAMKYHDVSIGKWRMTEQEFDVKSIGEEFLIDHDDMQYWNEQDMDKEHLNMKSLYPQSLRPSRIARSIRVRSASKSSAVSGRPQSFISVNCSANSLRQRSRSTSTGSRSQETPAPITVRTTQFLSPRDAIRRTPSPDQEFISVVPVDFDLSSATLCDLSIATDDFVEHCEHERHKVPE